MHKVYKVNLEPSSSYTASEHLSVHVFSPWISFLLYYFLSMNLCVFVLLFSLLFLSLD